jgi:hypothetical protein
LRGHEGLEEKRLKATKTVKTKGRAQDAANNLYAAYARLCQMLTRHEGKLSVAVRKPGTLWMAVTGAIYRGKPLFYAGVRMGKNYVSYHLMSIYMREVAISQELKKRKQGRACFNFTDVDEKLFDELDRLTVEGMKDYRPEILEKLVASHRKK